MRLWRLWKTRKRRASIRSGYQFNCELRRQCIAKGYNLNNPYHRIAAGWEIAANAWKEAANAWENVLPFQKSFSDHKKSVEGNYD